MTKKRKKIEIGDAVAYRDQLWRVDDVRGVIALLWNTREPNGISVAVDELIYVGPDTLTRFSEVQPAPVPKVEYHYGYRVGDFVEHIRHGLRAEIMSITPSGTYKVESPIGKKYIWHGEDLRLIVRGYTRSELEEDSTFSSVWNRRDNLKTVHVPKPQKDTVTTADFINDEVKKLKQLENEEAAKPTEEETSSALPIDVPGEPIPKRRGDGW
jgi:hypothetical protein